MEKCTGLITLLMTLTTISGRKNIPQYSGIGLELLALAATF